MRDMERLLPPNPPVEDPMQREEDARRLRQLRAALGLLAATLWAALAWRVGSLVVPREWWAGAAGRAGGRLSVEQIVNLSMVGAWCAAVVGLWARAGSGRWRRYALGLVALGAVDFGLALGEMCEAAPGHAGLLRMAGETTGWVELWLAAVVLAELGVGVGDDLLIRLTERTGPVLLFGGVAWAGLLGHFDWAKDELVTKNADGTPSSLVALLVVANLALFPVSLYLSARAAARAVSLTGHRLRVLEVEA